MTRERRPTSDFGTVVLHAALLAAFLVLLATGLRIASDDMDHAWLRALDAVFGDFDGDGDLDVALAVEYGVMQLRAWRNDGEGRFTDVTLTAMPGSAVGRHWSMAAGDLDGDMRDDLFVGAWGTQARLLLTDRLAARAARPRLILGQEEPLR